jgi:hypothetical protein
LRISILVSILIVFSAELYAQISASPYSAYGIGILKDRTSSMNRSMGGSGFAVRDPFNLNNLNPASYSSIQLATQVTEAGIYIESDRYRNSSQSSTLTTANLTNLNFWVRFTKRWSGSVGMSPLSSVNYHITSGRAIGDNSTSEYIGDGGVTQFYFGNGFQITKNLSIGATASFFHGSIDRKETITSGLALGTEVSNYTYINRGNIDYGLQYQFFLKNDRSITIGAVYNNKLRLNTSQQTTVYQRNDTLSSNKTDVADYVLPQKFGGGIAFQTKQSMFTVDLSYQQWSKGKLEDGLKLRDTRRMSVGYQFRGSKSADSFWNAVVFRTGYYVQENAMILQQTPFTDWGTTFGVGIPVSGKRNSLNLSYSYNHSGTLERSLIQQQSQIISLDITFRDLWGIKRKFD